MITNAIAEMRKYGEGFIIADQAPALLDMAAIRNTNTKIIMRLPDLADRELVGKAANLTDEQITELAKLPLGVAAVYQNEWIQPILCKIKKAKVSKQLYTYQPTPTDQAEDSIEDRYRIAQMLSSGMKIQDHSKFKERIDSLDTVSYTHLIKVFSLLLQIKQSMKSSMNMESTMNRSNYTSKAHKMTFMNYNKFVAY